MAVKKRTDKKGRVLPKGITQRKDGRYQGRIYEKGKELVLYDKDLASLKKKMDIKKGEYASGKIKGTKRYTLEEWYEEYLALYKKDTIKEATYTNYVNYFNWYYKKYPIAKVKLDKLEEKDILEHYEYLFDRKKLSYETVKMINRFVYGSLQKAVEKKLIAENPTADIMRKIKKPEAKEKTIYTEEEKKEFLEFVRHDRAFYVYDAMFTLMFGSGMRVGEVLALTWKDIDFNKNIIHVNKTLSYRKLNGENKQCFHITTPKTKSSRRMVPLMNVVKEALLELKKKQELVELDKVQFTVDEISDFVFVTSKGTTYSSDSINRVLRDIVKKYNRLEVEKAKKEKREAHTLKPITAHCFRHTFATECIEKNMEITTVSRILGHQSIKTTEAIYVHRTEKMAQQDAEVLNKILDL